MCRSSVRMLLSAVALWYVAKVVMRSTHHIVVLRSDKAHPGLENKFSQASVMVKFEEQMRLGQGNKCITFRAYTYKAPLQAHASESGYAPCFATGEEASQDRRCFTQCRRSERVTKHHTEPRQDRWDRLSALLASSSR